MPPRNTIATNLPLSRATIHKPSIPRRFQHPSARRKKRAAPPPPPADDDPFTALPALSDAAIALRTLHAAWPHEAFRKLPSTPPIALFTQLCALVADKNALDRELALLVARNEWRRIVLPSREHAFVSTADLSEALQDGDVLQRFARELLPTARDSVLPASRLREVYGEQADIAECQLVRAGWLTMRDVTSFWFAVPGMGAFSARRKEGTAELLNIMRRTPYKEMLLKKLEERSLKKTYFTAQWHVRDLVGGGTMETVETSVGTLVRLR